MAIAAAINNTCSMADLRNAFMVRSKFAPFFSMISRMRLRTMPALAVFIASKVICRFMRFASRNFIRYGDSSQLDKNLLVTPSMIISEMVLMVSITG